MQEFLQVELRKIFEDDRQWTINWDTYPLPMYASTNSMV